ncbi:MAG: MFS transporter [Acidimicrobiia bacterium]|nr:MFS transporter [Acidimicrobiia bacterium]
MVLIVAVLMLGAATAQAFGRFTYALLLPAIVSDFGISFTVAGTLATSNLVAYLAGTVLVSLASTRLSVIRIVQVSLAASTAGLAALAYGTGIGWLWFGMVVTGLAGAGVWVPSPGIAAAVAPADRRAFTIGFVGSGMGLGLAFVSFVAARAASEDWRGLYRIEFAVGVIAVAAAALLMPPVNLAAARPRLRVVRTIPGWRLLLAVYVAYGLAMSLFVNFLTAMLDDRPGVILGDAFGVFLWLALATVLGGPLFGPIADRVGREQAMMLGLAAMGVAALSVLAHNGAVVAASAIAFGLAFSGVPTAFAALVSDHVDLQSFGAAFGVATFAFGIAQVFGPQIGGVVVDAVEGFTPVYLASAALAASGAVIAAALTKVSIQRSS